MESCPPSEFLALAEQSGIINELDRWAFKTSCEQLRFWRSTIPGACALTVSVNLAARQFADVELASWIKTYLQDNYLDGTALVLELTENMVFENNSFSAARLQELRDLGIRIAIDDFGKGHSSFGRLQDLPISILKIDGSLIGRIQQGKAEIVDAVIALAKRLRLETTAECVETPEQFQHLLRAECTTAQGIYFAPALDASAAADLLRSQRQWRPPDLASAAKT